MIRIRVGVYKGYFIKKRSNKDLYIEHLGILIKSFSLWMFRISWINCPTNFCLGNQIISSPLAFAEGLFYFYKYFHIISAKIVLPFV